MPDVIYRNIGPDSRLPDVFGWSGKRRKWRRGELNPRPQIRCLKALHAYSIFCLTRIPPIDRLACRLFQFGFSTLALNKRKRDLMLDDAWNPNA